jgi:ribonuclease P protein component
VHRLRRSADFEAVFREGRRSQDQLFTVLYRHSGQEKARLGMTASARRVRGSVARNRLRRLIRESFRHARAEIGGLDVVVVVRDGAALASNSEVFSSLEAHWTRLQRAAVTT